MKNTQQRLHDELNSQHIQAKNLINELTNLVSSLSSIVKDKGKEIHEYYHDRTYTIAIDKAMIADYSKKNEELDKTITSLNLIATKYLPLTFILYIHYIANSLESSKEQIDLLNQNYQKFQALFLPVEQTLKIYFEGSSYLSSVGARRLKKTLTWVSPHINLDDIRPEEFRYSSGYHELLELFSTFGKISIENSSSSSKPTSETVIKPQFKIDSLAKIIRLYYINYEYYYSYQKSALETYVLSFFTVEMIDKLFPNQTEISLVLQPNVLNNKNFAFTQTSFEKHSALDLILLAIIFDNKLLLTALLGDYLSKNNKDKLEVLIRDNLLLGFAAVNGKAESIKILINHGANLEQKFSITVNQYVNQFLTPEQNINPLFNSLGKYYDKTLVLTPLGLVLAASTALGEKAKGLIGLLLDQRADYNYKVEYSWCETHGYYTSQQYVEKKQTISLFNFDQSGLLSQLVNERKAQKQQGPHHNNKSHNMLHQYGRQQNLSNSNNQPIAASTPRNLINFPTQSSGESDTDFLKRENDTLKTQINALWEEINKLKLKVDELESKGQPHHRTGGNKY